MSTRPSAFVGSVNAVVFFYYWKEMCLSHLVRCRWERSIDGMIADTRKSKAVIQNPVRVPLWCNLSHKLTFLWSILGLLSNTYWQKWFILLSFCLTIFEFKELYTTLNFFKPAFSFPLLIWFSRFRKAPLRYQIKSSYGSFQCTDQHCSNNTLHYVRL